MNKAVIYSSNDCFIAHGMIGKMTLLEETAIAGERGIVYLVEVIVDKLIEIKMTIGE